MIKGLDKLKVKLRIIPKRAREAANAVLIEAAEEIATLQRGLAPEDDGDLKDSIHVTKPGESTPPYSQPGGKRKAGKSQAIITAGNTKVRYAHLVEFGTAPHINGGQFAGTAHPGTSPQPFFWPGYRALRTRAKGRITRSVTKAIKQAATSGGSSP